MKYQGQGTRKGKKKKTGRVVDWDNMHKSNIRKPADLNLVSTLWLCKARPFFRKNGSEYFLFLFSAQKGKRKERNK